MVSRCRPLWCPRVAPCGVHAMRSMVSMRPTAWCPCLTTYGAHASPPTVSMCLPLIRAFSESSGSFLEFCNAGAYVPRHACRVMCHIKSSPNQKGLRAAERKCMHSSGRNFLNAVRAAEFKQRFQEMRTNFVEPSFSSWAQLSPIASV